MNRGGLLIETWVEPCPHCAAAVAVTPDTGRVTCAACRGSFRPEGRPTVVRERDEEAAPPADPTDPLVGTRMGGWTLTRLIGRGGMGRVYEAQDARGRRRAALKVLREDLAADPSFVRRFHREAKLLGSLVHPHIVDVLEQGEQDGRLWFAMAYVRGENLRRRIDRGPLDPREAGRIAAEVAGALAYAHARGVVHRDLKPENVLLDERGGVHLVDFGLSRLVHTAPEEASTRLTRTDVILGTYEYMAPEQRRGDRELDGRADVFALGVMLYEMLTGTLPLGRFTPPSEVSAAVPPAFDEVVNRALATLPKDRFPDATALEGAIQKAAASKVRTRPAPTRPPEDEGPVPQHEVDEARSVLRHVEFIAALDRVGGLVLVLGALGFFSILPFVMPFGLPLSFVGVLAFILGLHLLNLGKRLQLLQPASRQGQVTASVIMLFLPPFFTALGIYALIVMTSERARQAFRLGRRVLGDEAPHPIHVKHAVAETPRPRPRAASFAMRAFCFFAILWSVYAFFLALDLLTDQGIYSQQLSDYRAIASGAGIAAIVALVVLVRMFFHRRRRRGVGLALTAFLVLYGSTALLNFAADEAQARSLLRGGAATIRSLPHETFRNQSPFRIWERSK